MDCRPRRTGKAFHPPWHQTHAQAASSAQLAPPADESGQALLIHLSARAPSLGKLTGMLILLDVEELAVDGCDQKALVQVYRGLRSAALELVAPSGESARSTT